MDEFDQKLKNAKRKKKTLAKSPSMKRAMTIGKTKKELPGMKDPLPFLPTAKKCLGEENTHDYLTPIKGKIRIHGVRRNSDKKNLSLSNFDNFEKESTIFETKEPAKPEP